MSRLATLPVSLPQPSSPKPPNDLAERILTSFDNLTEDCFVEDATWRDSYAVTGTLRTFYGTASISRAWKDCLKLSKASIFTIAPIPPEEMRLPGGSFWMEIGYGFETDDSYCIALVSVVPDPAGGSGWKIWVLRTILQQLKGAPRIDVYDPSAADGGGMVNGNGTTTNGTSQESSYQFDCVIVGAGQAGLDAAARCAAQEISYVVIDKQARMGDNWRNRYDSARLHTVREYAHLPYERTFDESYPEYLHKDDLAQAYARYVEKMHINVWLSSLLQSGQWDESRQKWTLHVKTDGVSREVASHFVILAVGAGGQVPSLPVLPGRVSLLTFDGAASTNDVQEKFKGVVLHSEEYRSSKGFAGRRGVVVGSANTAHDVADDMLDAGLASVTMVQRSKTFVLPQEWYVQTQTKLYNAALPTDTGDMLSNTYPNAVFRLIGSATFHTLARMDPGRFEALENAGFRVDVFGDPAYHLFERLGGHYMDVGVSAKIAAGQVVPMSFFPRLESVLIEISRSR